MPPARRNPQRDHGGALDPGSCGVCLELKSGKSPKCHSGGGHDTKSECEGHTKNPHLWCGGDRRLDAATSARPWWAAREPGAPSRLADGPGAWCAARCPDCAVVDGSGGFDFGAEKACVCLDDDRVPDGTEITLTPFDDCARVAGSELYLYADDGADVVEAVGDYVYLDGGWGDDTLSATGGYNYVVGQGGVDTCFNGGEGGCTCEIKDCGDDAP